MQDISSEKQMESQLEQMQFHLMCLPQELLCYMLSFLSSEVRDLLRLRETCVLFREISLHAVKDLNLRKFAPNITDAVLSNILSYCHDLRVLCISNCLVTDTIFSDLVRFCPRLTGLHAYNIVMTSECVDIAAQVMPGLRELTLGRGASCPAIDATQDDDISMRLLGFCDNLTTLNLCFRTARSLSMMRSGLFYLKRCTNIEKITIYTQLKIRSNDTAQFCKLPHLTTLLFASAQLTTGAMNALGECLKLTELYLHDVILSENGMAALAEIPFLKRLFLVRIRGLTDLGVARLALCPSLEGLEIVKSETLTDEGIAPIAKCQSLRIVCLEQTPNVTLNIKKSFQLCSIVVVLS